MCLKSRSRAGGKGLRGPQDCKVLVLTAPCHLRRLPRCSWPLRLQLTRSLPSRHCFSLAPLTGLTGTTRARRPAVNVVGGTWLAVELCIFFDYHTSCRCQTCCPHLRAHRSPVVHEPRCQFLPARCCSSFSPASLLFFTAPRYS